ncbi:hypothetical protein [Streptomyces sp. H51]|uniref:hypothetical protein n=1 Tax=Streptomyces sp. H51 TaxID=3111770 RepID=UPI002D7A249B|nr:hypothetical protein [Streptomyces sp. H51]
MTSGSNSGPAVTAFLVTGALLVTGAACSGPPPERLPQALPQVETGWDRAVLTAQSEVPGAKLLSVRITDASGPDPVWLTRVADQQGTVHAVRVEAIRGRFLGTSVPSGQSTARKTSTAALISSAKVLPYDAVDKVKQPDFGKVTDVGLEKGRQGRTVWSVTIVTVQGSPARVYQVDALTAEVVDSRTVASGTPQGSEPAGPAVSASKSPG